MYEFDERCYNMETQGKINRGILHSCSICDSIIHEGVFIRDTLYCNECAKEEFLDSTDDDLREVLEDWESPDIWVICQEMSLEDICGYMGWDIWED